MTELVKITPSQKLELKNKNLKTVATELLGDNIPLAKPKEPVFPTPVEVTDDVARAIREIGKLFNKVAPEAPRALDKAEIAHLTAEAEALSHLEKLFTARRENIKEYVRNHLDATADHSYGKDSMGHELLAQPKEPAVLEVPGSNIRWSNEYRSGAVVTKTDRLGMMLESGEIDYETYKALTTPVRVPDESKITNYVLRTGDLELLAKLTEGGRPQQALNLRGITRKK